MMPPTMGDGATESVGLETGTHGERAPHNLPSFRGDSLSAFSSDTIEREMRLEPQPFEGLGLHGATTGTRTLDLSLTKDALYH